MALTAKKVYAILKRQISDMEAKLNSPVRHRGTVATADLLPLNPDIGDMYNIESKSVYGEAGMNVAWNGVVWDTMGAPIDMSLYLTKEEAEAVIQRLVTEYFEKNPVKPGATTEQAQQIEQNKADIASLKTETDSLKEDISTKITKFYASSQGKTHLADSDNGKIMDMMVYGKSEQKQYSGKNLLNPTLQTTTKNGVTCTNNGDGTYTLNGTATATDIFTLHSNIDFTGQMRLCGGTSLVSLQYSNSSNFAYEDKGAGIIIEHFDSVTYPNASFNILIKINNVYNNALVKPMLTTDLTATYDDFEPYTGGIPSPNPDYPQEIKSVVNPTVKITNEDGTQFKTVTLPYTLNAIPVNSGGNVTIGGQQYIADYVDVERGKLVRMVDSSKLDNTQSIVNKTEWLLAEPQETDLTKEEIAAFKALATYYPTTNISVNSEQLDGYTVFNYPIPFEDEWIKTKKDVDSLKARLNDIVGYDNAAAHNAIYRGKNLGTQFTAEMSANIKNGTFKDLYCGDYLVINGTTYRFMDLDYLYKTGDTSLETHHILVVPDAPMYNHVMNDTNTTEGGYVGSKMYTSGLDQALAKIKADFGESHIVTYRNLLVNTVSNGVCSNWAWYSRQIDLMNEEMVYGTRAWSQASQNGYDTGSNKSQLAAFKHNHSLISSCRSWYWLRAVQSSTGFCNVASTGYANPYSASSAIGVRPCFLIS
jgi:hypothetical protein